MKRAKDDNTTLATGSTSQQRPSQRQATANRPPHVSSAMDPEVLATKATHYLSSLKVKWMQLQDTPTIFAYVLNIQGQKFLKGIHNIYVELNPDRSASRRRPQTITSLDPPFAPKKFNFNKVDPLEVMMTIPFDSSEVQILINKSPLTKYHSLICPQIEMNLNQRLTLYGLQFVTTFLRHAKDADCRIGYNSPGALASVNHLHFHLIHLPQRIYIDGVKLKKLADEYIYRLEEGSPTEAICFVIDNNESDAVANAKMEKLFKLTEWLCSREVPHNIFITLDRSGGEHKNALKIFLFARVSFCECKEINQFNIGFCEQAGYVTLYDQTQMDEITEETVLNRIREETLDVYADIYDYVKKIP